MAQAWPNSQAFAAPAPRPLKRPLGALGLIKTLFTNPIEAWTERHFTERILVEKYPLGRIAVINEPHAIARVLLVNADNYRKDGLQRRILSSGLGSGLLASEGMQWKRQRRTLAPIFNHRVVESFAPAVNAAAQALVDRWNSMPDGAIVDLSVEMTRVTLDVLVRTVFSDGLGDDPELIRSAMRTYFNALGRIDPADVLGLPDFVPRITRLNVRSTLKYFNTAVDALIARCRASAGRDPANDILSSLLKAADPHGGVGMSDTEVRANVLTFIAAGHETTSNTLTWSTFLLSQSPDWLNAVMRESPDNRDASGVAGLHMTRTVIDEALRLYPPIVAISRQAITADVLSGHSIAPGTMVVISPYVLHRHHSIWTEPQLFNPERFLPERKRAIGRYEYLPFGAGPRVCIGAAFALQEAVIVLNAIVRHFEFRLPIGHQVRPMQRMTLGPQGGMPMIISRRRRVG